MKLIKLGPSCVAFVEKIPNKEHCSLVNLYKALDYARLLALNHEERWLNKEHSHSQLFKILPILLHSTICDILKCFTVTNIQLG